MTSSPSCPPAAATRSSAPAFRFPAGHSRYVRFIRAGGLWFDQVLVPLIARRWSADVLFTMNNQPALAARCPQVLLFHNPYYIYPLDEWSPLLTGFERVSLSLQRRLFSVTARHCARVAAQTSVAAKRVQQQYAIHPERLTIVANAVAPEHERGETDAGRQLAARMDQAASGRTSVLTLARYYPHKDLEFVFALRVACARPASGGSSSSSPSRRNSTKARRRCSRRSSARVSPKTWSTLGRLGTASSAACTRRPGPAFCRPSSSR